MDSCCQRPVVFKDALRPVSLKVTVRRRNADVDLSVAASAYFLVRKPDQTDHTWTATIVETDETFVVLRYSFVSGDVPLLGTYLLFPQIGLPSGTYPAKPCEFDVEDYGANTVLVAYNNGALVFPVQLETRLVGG